MTASTLNRQAGEGVEHGADHVVPVKVACDLAVDFGFGYLGVADVVPGAGGQESRCHHAVDSGGEQNIAGNLFKNETVEGLVTIESPDHVVAVGPRVGAKFVLVVSVCVAVVSYIEPVSGPTFTVTGALHQPLHQSRIGLVRLVGKKGVDLGRGGRQARQVDGHTPHKRAAIGCG